MKPVCTVAAPPPSSLSPMAFSNRKARLQQVARAYAEGSYKIDAAATGSKMIQESLELSRPAQRVASSAS
jgi:hypothetical protein